MMQQSRGGRRKARKFAHVDEAGRQAGAQARPKSHRHIWPYDGTAFYTRACSVGAATDVALHVVW